MKKQSKLYWAFSVAMLTLAMVACAKSSDNKSSDTNNTVVTGAIPPGTKVGFYAQNQMMNYMYPGSTGTTLTISNSTNMTKLLRDIMGVCDRNYSDGGYSACSTWINGYIDVMIFANGSNASTVKLVVRAYPAQSNFWYSLPSLSQFFLSAAGFNVLNNAAMYNPLVLDATINPVTINGQQGFQLNANGPAGATYNGGVNNLINLRVLPGKLDDAGFDFTLYLNNSINTQGVATGHMLRCQTQNCGVNGF